MHYPTFKKFIVPIFTLVLLAGLNVSHAQTTASVCASVNLEDPSPLAIVCPIVRVFNIAIFAAGAIFVGMIVYGAIKLALSLGDPKGYQGAQQTWFWSVIGLLVVIGVFTLLYVIDNILGTNYLSGGPNAITDRIIQNLSGLFTTLNITGF